MSWKTIEWLARDMAITMAAWLIILSASFALADDDTDEPLYLCAVTVNDELMRPAVFKGEVGVCTFLDHMGKLDAKMRMVCFDAMSPDASEVKGSATGMRAVMRCDSRKGVKGL